MDGTLFLFFGADLNLLVFDIEAEVIVDAHVLIRDPDQREEGNQVSSPPGIKKFEACDDQEQSGHVVAEAIFAGEQVKEFAPRQGGRLFRLLLAIIARLSKNFFVSYGPGDTSNGDR